MASAICPIVDQSPSAIRKNMTRIKLLTVAGPLLCHAAQHVYLLKDWSFSSPEAMTRRDSPVVLVTRCTSSPPRRLDHGRHGHPADVASDVDASLGLLPSLPVSDAAGP